MSKKIHIVFQVLNFLSFPHLSEKFELSTDEKLLLIFLAKYKGVKGICPSVSTLSRELQRTRRPIQKSLARLSDKKLLIIDPVAGKSNLYTVVLPPMDLSTTCVVDDTCVVEDAASPKTQGVRRGERRGGVVDDAQSVIGNNQRNSSSPRARKRTLLTDDFVFDAETKKHVKAYGLGKEAELDLLDGFFEYHQKQQTLSADWNKMFRGWVDMDVSRSQKKSSNEPEPIDPYKAEELKAPRTGMQGVGKVLSKFIKPNGQGGHNGQGSRREGKD